MKKAALLSILFLMGTGLLNGHPLGVFSTNQYTRLEIAGPTLSLVYVMDMGEIPTMQELKRIDGNGDGVFGVDERTAYVDQLLPGLMQGLALKANGKQLKLRMISYDLSFPEGQGGLRTLRFAPLFEATLASTDGEQSVEFRNTNFSSSRGWQEIVVRPLGDARLLECSAPTEDATDELRNFTPVQLASPISVREATFRFIPDHGAVDEAADRVNTGLVQAARDGFAELISARDLTVPAILISLAVAFLLGAGHALTPGHGKTVVAAYLVGSRGTAKHAAFLGFTVTATHTIGVFGMGLISLFASQYILPETLFPWLSLLSGLIVVGIGVSLFVRRFRSARQHSHEHDPLHHVHGPEGHTHSHLPLGADGLPVTWKNLLGLGISGGLLPCPSAIVVLLSAIALGRIGFGLLLIVAFSLGLAGLLTGIGLLMVYARGFFERFNNGSSLFRWLPVGSAMVVAVAGMAISGQALGETGIQLPTTDPSLTAGALSVLVLGFVLGLKHALDADHLIAVSTIVSERKGFFSSSVVGVFWGLGHTASLLLVGIAVIALQIRIPEKIALTMEFCVAAMLVALGVNVVRKLLRGGKLHVHLHSHDDHGHLHPHVHEHAESHAHSNEHSHHPMPFGLFPAWWRSHARKSKRSIFIGMVHGLAGSAALMLIVLATIPSPALALTYIGVFGLGSIGGMLVMSTLIGLPFALTAHKSERLNFMIRGMSGVLSIAFGLFLAWQIGFVDGLFF